MAFRQLLNALRATRTGAVVSCASIPLTAKCSSFAPTQSGDATSPKDGKVQFHQDSSNFTYDYMLKQSTIDAVNNASRFLTTTYAAIEITSTEYRSLLSKLIVLLEETMLHSVPDAHWDLIVEVRSEVQAKKEAITKLMRFMEHVRRMAESASQLTFSAGMENLSITLCQRIDDAVTKTEKECMFNKDLESQYSRLQEECIRNSDKKKDPKDLGPGSDQELLQGDVPVGFEIL